MTHKCLIFPVPPLHLLLSSPHKTPTTCKAPLVSGVSISLIFLWRQNYNLLFHLPGTALLLLFWYTCCSTVYFFTCSPNSFVSWAAFSLSHAKSTVLQRAMHSSGHHSLNPSFLPRHKLPRRRKKPNQTKPSCPTHPRLPPSVSVNTTSQTLGLYFPSIL